MEQVIYFHKSAKLSEELIRLSQEARLPRRVPLFITLSLLFNFWFLLTFFAFTVTLLPFLPNVTPGSYYKDMLLSRSRKKTDGRITQSFVKYLKSPLRGKAVRVHGYRFRFSIDEGTFEGKSYSSVKTGSLTKGAVVQIQYLAKNPRVCRITGTHVGLTGGTYLLFLLIPLAVLAIALFFFSDGLKMLRLLRGGIITMAKVNYEKDFAPVRIKPVYIRLPYEFSDKRGKIHDIIMHKPYVKDCDAPMLVLYDPDRPEVYKPIDFIPEIIGIGDRGVIESPHAGRICAILFRLLFFGAGLAFTVAMIAKEFV